MTRAASILLLITFLSVTGCERNSLEVRGTRTLQGTGSIIYVDVRIDGKAKEQFDRSGEALYLNIYRCSGRRDTATAHALISRTPVTQQGRSVWMRFSVYPAVKVLGDDGCGFLSSSGYSLSSASSEVFRIN